jgi:hypothetical protein
VISEADFEVLDVSATQHLVEARVALHWAVQLASAAGTTLADAEDDFGHTTLTWLYGPSALAGVALPSGRRAALRVRELVLAVFGSAGDTLAELDLRGKTIGEGIDWLGSTLGAEVARPVHVLPVHPVEAGAPFAAPPDAALDAIARWFGNAARLLGTLSGSEWDASPVRCWPHHFDIATLIALDAGSADPERARSIGVGMTPGDAGVPSPYFYVTPWPYPSTDALPALEGGGRWNTKGWVGALLRAEDLVAGPAAAQHGQITVFIRSAVDAEKRLL